ncbi:MAG: TIGR04282 family arsenosugar biosynthesis glycosyltransferase [Candidatus Binatia bacterium]
MRRGLVYIMAKEPRPGLVKTRLCPPLTPVQACRVAEAFAIDTLTTISSLDEVEVRLALDDARAEPGAGSAGESAAPPSSTLRRVARDLGMSVEDQGDGDLGVRMRLLLERGLADGLPTILVGTDCPDLPRSTIPAALDALGHADVVIAPSHDGGYVLVGAARPVAELFRIDAPWSSARVFAATCEALRRAGCAFEALDAWDDVDDAAALGRLASRLDATAAAPATARLLETLRTQGVGF